jgi:hypothetical protein
MKLLTNHVGESSIRGKFLALGINPAIQISSRIMHCYLEMKRLGSVRHEKIPKQTFER